MNDLDIIEGLKNDDRATFEYLYRTLGPRTIGHVELNSGSREDGKDHLQKCLMLVWENVKSGKYTHRDRFEAYFFQIVRHRWLDELDYRARRPKSDNFEDSPTIADNSFADAADLDEKEKEMRAFDKAFQRLTDEDRQLLKKRYFEGKTNVALAQEEGIPPNTMNQRMNAARNRLEAFINEERRPPD